MTVSDKDDVVEIVEADFLLEEFSYCTFCKLCCCYGEEREGGAYAMKHERQWLNCIDYAWSFAADTGLLVFCFISGVLGPLLLVVTIPLWLIPFLCILIFVVCWDASKEPISNGK